MKFRCGRGAHHLTNLGRGSLSSRIRAVLFLLVLSLVTADDARSQEKQIPRYTHDVATKHSGEEAIVTGKVVAVAKSSSGTIYLNFGDRFPRHTFSAVVLPRDQEAVGDVQHYAEKSVRVSGKISLRDSKPQIIVRSRAQIALDDAAPSPLPPSPQPPSPTPAAPNEPKTAVPSAPLPKETSEPTIPKPPANERRIVLGTGWNSPTQTGHLTRKDLAMIFSACGQASESAVGDPSIQLYPDIPFFTTLAEAKGRLRLDGASASKVEIVCPGIPLDSFWSHTFEGVFPGGYDRLCLITDASDQVISVQLVEVTSRQRSSDITDLFAYHTYNFISYRVKGNAQLVIKHEVVKGTPGVFVVDSVLIDPNANALVMRTSSSRRSGQTQNRSARTGKVLERSRWFVPVPLVNLILRCVADR